MNNLSLHWQTRIYMYIDYKGGLLSEVGLKPTTCRSGGGTELDTGPIAGWWCPFFFWKILRLQVGINTNLHDFYRNLWVWTWYQYQIFANLDSFWKIFGFHLNIFRYLWLILDLLVQITTNTPQKSSKDGHCMKRIPLDSIQIQSKNRHNKVTLIFPSSKI